MGFSRGSGNRFLPRLYSAGSFQPITGIQVDLQFAGTRGPEINRNALANGA